MAFTVACHAVVSIPGSSPANDQRVLLHPSKLLHRVLPCQRLPHRPERFLIHQPDRPPARGVLRPAAVVVRQFARTRVARISGVERAVRAADDVDEVHASILAGLEAIVPQSNAILAPSGDQLIAPPSRNCTQRLCCFSFRFGLTSWRATSASGGLTPVDCLNVRLK